jgi:SAM-dependent methyltransferase
MKSVWDRNAFYHDVVLNAVPDHCRRALDVGCGEGLLARELAKRCENVVAIDVDPIVLERARAAANPHGVTFVAGDVLTYPLPENGFDFISAVAALHHLPLTVALRRFSALLRSGGVLAVIGLYRAKSLADYTLGGAALPASLLQRCLHRRKDEVMRVKEPAESLDEIRSACDEVLRGAVVRRHFLFRYSLIWRKR